MLEETAGLSTFVKGNHVHQNRAWTAETFFNGIVHYQSVGGGEGEKI